MLYHCQVMSLQVVMPPLHQRAPEMRSPNRIGEVKVAEAEVLSVVAPAGPTVAVALALPTGCGVLCKRQQSFDDFDTLLRGMVFFFFIVIQCYVLL